MDDKIKLCRQLTSIIIQYSCAFIVALGQHGCVFPNGQEAKLTVTHLLAYHHLQEMVDFLQDAWTEEGLYS